MPMKMPKTCWIVAQKMHTTSPLELGDLHDERDLAVEMFEDCMIAEWECRVFEMSFDVETNAHEATRDVTDDFRSEYEEAQRDAGIFPADTQQDTAYDEWKEAQ